MPTPTADQVRSQFIDFFRSKGHTFVPSSPVVPVDDPTLLFTNAGMNQFKPIFLGQADPTSELGRLKRAVNSQKCIRAGGKHNDLEDVGKDTYHHTFFEMLGNWSFGDYFKVESIGWGMELLTEVFGIPKDRLYATYFGGDPESGLEPDLEARDIWLQHLPASHVLPGSMKDNFWEMGETGPCGPCSEIHYDRVGGRDAASLVNAGDPDVIEIWNHVFIQFNREDDRSLRPLPAKHIDTGMGFERLVSVLQNKRSNYDTDVFAPIFAAIERVTGARPYMGRLGDADKDRVDTAYRVIADHIRTLTFAITDGAVPSNEGRGYVLRRILRRAVRFGRQMLGARTGFFSQLVPVVVDRMGHAFPELTKDPQRVAAIILEEEESFGRTLDRGVGLFDEACARAITAGVLKPGIAGRKTQVSQRRKDGEVIVELAALDTVGAQGPEILEVPMRAVRPQWIQHVFQRPPVISGEDVFKLYDTYGFPVDLTNLMAEERGLQVDHAGFERLMNEAKEKARAAGKFSAQQEGVALSGEAVAQLRAMGIDATLDGDKYGTRDIRATVRAIYNGANFDENATAAGTLRPIGLVLDRTNFYAEMGGQEADTGRILVTRDTRSAGGSEGGEFRVEHVAAYGGYVLHVGRVVRGEIRVGDDVQLFVDQQRRGAIMSNHTATHLLNWALRETLGSGVDQKGSLVAPDRLRFDFSHSKPVSPTELSAIEQLVREKIAADLPVYADAAPLNLARNITGLRAVFGEAYPDPVRVVSIGVPVSKLLDDTKNPEWQKYSIEFCGGTHVASTKEIAAFALTEEEAVAKGIRRVVALTGVAAIAAEQAADNAAQRIEAAASLPPAELAPAINAITAELGALTMPAARKAQLRAKLAELQEKVKAAQKQASANLIAEVVSVARRLGESAAASMQEIVVNSVEAGSDRAALQAALDAVMKAAPRAAVMLFSRDTDSGKVNIIAGVPDALVKRGLNAGEWVRAAAEACGGKGGGKPHAAQGGGTDLSKVKAAMDVAETMAVRKLMG
jgi:alanyl-tRNA synthetase